MRFPSFNFVHPRQRLPLVLVLLATLWVGLQTVSAETETKASEEIRTLAPAEWGAPHPAAIAYSARNQLFFLIEKAPDAANPDSTNLVVITPYERLVQTLSLPFAHGGVANLAFDDSANRLWLLGGAPLQLVQISLGADGLLDPASITHSDATRLGLINPAGLAIDPAGQFLLILDRYNSQIVRLDLTAPLASAPITTVALGDKKLGQLRGLAINPTDQHLFVANPAKQMLYELSAEYKYIAQYDLNALQLVDLAGLVFAASPDLTDNAATTHLFIADSHLPTAPAADPVADGTLRAFLPAIFQTSDSIDEAQIEAEGHVAFGRIIELSLAVATDAEAIGAAGVDATLTLVQTINTSDFNPPSPDPSGITFVAGAPGQLVITDGEVEEMPIFAGVNMWRVTLPNTPAVIGSTTRYTNEPTDIAYDAANNRYFISDDDTGRIFEVRPGADNTFGTTDDVRTFFSTLAYGSNDPEGLDYANGELWEADGVNREVYRIHPGADGIFNGVPAVGGDDVVTHFDVNTLSVGDPEGIDYVSASPSDYLLLTGRSANFIYELTPLGTFIRSHNISAAGAIKLAGIVLAPASNGSGTLNYWVVDRGIDNNDVPSENDGRLYEFSNSGGVPTPTPTPPPAPPATLYFSSESDGTIGGVTYSDEDILSHNTTTGAYGLIFDGSAHSVTSDVRAFDRLSNGDLLLNFISQVNLPGLDGPAEIIDVVRYHVATGVYSRYFDGSDVGLITATKGIDALSVLPNAPFDKLLMSFAEARIDLPLSGTITRVNDEDIVLFTPISEPGSNTLGNLTFYFDGSDVGLNTSDSEDIKGLWIDPLSGELYLNTYGVFGVTGVSGDGSDTFICHLNTPPGDVTNCTFRMFWDGSINGFTQIMDAVAVQLQ